MIASPPTMTKAIMARKVVTWVSTVRDSVSLIERSSSSVSGIFLYLRKFSRIRSKITTLSLSE